MTSDPSQAAPSRRKPNAFWWAAGAFLVLVLLFFLQLFGPNPAVVISRETTFITQPLRPDGLPDFERYLLERSREGITPENNAAVLIWQATWPGELSVGQYEEYAKELGLPSVPQKVGALVPVHKNEVQAQIADWLSAKNDNPAVEGGTSKASAEQIIDRAMIGPWRSEQIPPLADWVAANERPLDLLIEASRRPRYYSPSPELLNHSPDSLGNQFVPGIQYVRASIRALTVRGMWHLGEGRHAEAWQQLLAAHRLARLASHGQFLVEQLVATSSDTLTSAATAALLLDETLPEGVARQISRDLAILPAFAPLSATIGGTERMMYLDIILQMIWGGAPMTAAEGFLVDDPWRNVRWLSVDWNVTLRKRNEFFDRLAAALNHTSWAQRQQALADLEKQAGQFAAQDFGAGTVPAMILSRRVRSKVIADVAVAVLSDYAAGATLAWDRAVTMWNLNRVAAELAAYRAETGEYPEKLTDVPQTEVASLPVDLYSDKPFFYRRMDDGYLLYSFGANGIDDGGSNKGWGVFEGQLLESMAEEEANLFLEKIANEADDWAIRAPRRKVALPAPAAGG